jgi:cytochrome P450
MSSLCIGLLSFTFYYLLKHPKYMDRLRAEIDDVLGDQPLRVEHLSKLPFTTGTHAFPSASAFN